LWGSLASCAPVAYRRFGRLANPPDPEGTPASLPHNGRGPNAFLWLRLNCSVPPGPRYLALFFISDSTFLKFAGTSKSEGSTAFEENVLSSVVISSSEPGAPDPDEACPPEAC
jgi:hypothetical protein